MNLCLPHLPKLDWLGKTTLNAMIRSGVPLTFAIRGATPRRRHGNSAGDQGSALQRSFLEWSVRNRRNAANSPSTLSEVETLDRANVLTCRHKLRIHGYTSTTRLST